MNDFDSPIGMSVLEEGAAAPVLQGVQAAGKLNGLLLDLIVRQTYRNASTDTMEVTYTFPVPSGAVLLGLHVELDGRRLAGVVTAKAEADRRYEKAMSDGDAPIMLERSGDGLYSASLGNLKPGEDAVIEYRYGQLLAFDQGRVRLCIPTTIAPRYGDAVAHGRLQAHQVPQATLSAEYPLTLTLDVNGVLSRGEIGCATHACTFNPTPTGVQISLGQRAWLDRDVVITLETQGLPSVGEIVKDGDDRVALVSFQPNTTAVVRPQIDLKLLVDCSGSMTGDSIESARVALKHVVRQLREKDQFSFSRFGSTTWHGFRRMAPARATNLKMLLAMIDATDADLGGTEMETALKSTFALRGTGAVADVLIITDGEVWGADSLIALAHSCGHRIFAVGVGAAPAESLLRQLAVASGGACEFATPGESLQAAIDRMFARIRQQPCGNVRLVWDGDAPAPLWTTPLPAAMFAGDTQHVFAGFSGIAPTNVRLMAGDTAQDAHELACALIEAGSDAIDTLPRMAAATRLVGCPKAEAVALALRYQLVTEDTNFIVVHERADADKALDFAKLHQVPQMLTAGWGGTGSVMYSTPHPPPPNAVIALMRPASQLDAGDTDVSYMLQSAFIAPMRSETRPLSDWPGQSEEVSIGGSNLFARQHLVEQREIMQQALRTLSDAGGPPLQVLLDQLDVADDVTQCIAALVGIGLDRSMAWAMLVRWLIEQLDIEVAVTLQAAVALESLVNQVTEVQWRAAMRILEAVNVDDSSTGVPDVVDDEEAIVNLETQLKAWCNTARGPYRRPFAPNPDWARAQVFIVGSNPATPLRDEFASFAEYWNALTGNPDLFNRLRAAKKDGKVTKSTERATTLAKLIRPLNSLITNVSWFPVQREKDVPGSEWAFGQDALRTLVSQIKPSVIFCHGSVAERFAKSLHAGVDRYMPPESQNTTLDGTLILAYHHLSGQGLRKGTRFAPASELPRFADRIKRHVGVA